MREPVPPHPSFQYRWTDNCELWSTGLVTAPTRRFCLLHCARFGPGTPASRTAGALRSNYGNIYTGRPVKQHVTGGRTLRCDVMSGGRGQQLVRCVTQRPGGWGVGLLLIGIRPKYPGASDQRQPAGAFSRRHSAFTSLTSCQVGRHFHQSHLKVVQFRWYVGWARCHRDGDRVVHIPSKTGRFVIREEKKRRDYCFKDPSVSCWLPKVMHFVWKGTSNVTNNVF